MNLPFVIELNKSVDDILIENKLLYSTNKTLCSGIKDVSIFFCLPISFEQLDPNSILVNHTLISSKMQLKGLFQRLKKTLTKNKSKIQIGSIISTKLCKNPLKEVYGLDGYHIYSKFSGCIIYPKFLYKKYTSVEQLQRVIEFVKVIGDTFSEMNLKCENIGQRFNGGGGVVGLQNDEDEDDRIPIREHPLFLSVKNMIGNLVLEDFTIKEKIVGLVDSARIISYIIRLGSTGGTDFFAWVSIVGLLPRWSKYAIKGIMRDIREGKIRGKLIAQFAGLNFQLVAKLFRKVSNLNFIKKRIDPVKIESTQRKLDQLNLIGRLIRKRKIFILAEEYFGPRK